MTPQPQSTREKTFEEKAASEEWGAWKIVSEMLDNPNQHGIYPTSKCYEQIHDFVVEQKAKAAATAREEGYQQGKENAFEEATKILRGITPTPDNQ